MVENGNGMCSPYSLDIASYSCVTESGALNHGFPAEFGPNGANKSAPFR
jgi:hypothetical protein